MSTFLEHMQKIAAQPVHNGCQWFLMIDCAVNLKTNLARELQLDIPAVDLLTLMPVDWLHCVSPVLLQLPIDTISHTKNSAWQQFMQRWQYTNALTLLESSLPFEQLSQALHNRTNALLPDTMDVILRFFDTRTLAALINILNPEQLALFTSIAWQWIYIDRYGKAQTLQANRSGIADQFLPPLKFNTLQETQLIDAGEVDAMVNLLINQDDSQLIRLMPPKQYELISNLLSSAKKYQIHQLTEQAAFCRVGLGLGGDFHLQNPWNTELVAVTTGKQTFTNLLEAIVV